jgi:cytochrome c oxidase subunit 2
MGSEQITTTPETRRGIVKALVIAAIASALGVALGLAIDWFPIAASEEADKIDTLYDVLIIASVPVFVLVCTVVLYAASNFKMKPGEELKDGPPIHGNTRLEVIWTLIPALMMFALCAYAYVILDDIEDAKADSKMTIRVVGEQFTWTFYYPAEDGGKEIASSQLYVPAGQQILFQVQAKDVLHDFWVPAWRQKIDAVPGITTNFRVTPNKVGTYEVVCAELCGLGHATMRQTARVIDQAEFDKWLADKRAGKGMNAGSTNAAPKPEDGGTEAPEGANGEELFTAAQPSCGSCHTLSAAGTEATIGPSLDESLKDKDAAYIRESIVKPDSRLAEGFEDKGGIMPPTYGETLTPEEIDALVDYLVKATR